MQFSQILPADFLNGLSVSQRVRMYCNQAAYPQPSGQTPGCGFPVMGIMGVFNHAHGGWEDFVEGEHTAHDAPIFHKLLHCFEPGDILCGDRAFCTDELMGRSRYHRGQHLALSRTPETLPSHPSDLGKHHRYDRRKSRSPPARSPRAKSPEEATQTVQLPHLPSLRIQGNPPPRKSPVIRLKQCHSGQPMTSDNSGPTHLKVEEAGEVGVIPGSIELFSLDAALFGFLTSE